MKLVKNFFLVVLLMIVELSVGFSIEALISMTNIQ
ncbi:hypothetical protein JOC74_004065 [Bacillus capparidis]|uniref:Uncharacterized protein n=1 Tax=Bacillus capparidis TaxID=1840411 RepID=A0ABS4D1N7_9BACI|nr:hypothetical protein [Bacillus capparidis]